MAHPWDGPCTEQDQKWSTPNKRDSSLSEAKVGKPYQINHKEIKPVTEKSRAMKGINLNILEWEITWIIIIN